MEKNKENVFHAVRFLLSELSMARGEVNVIIETPEDDFSKITIAMKKETQSSDSFEDLTEELSKFLNKPLYELTKIE